MIEWIQTDLPRTHRLKIEFFVSRVILLKRLFEGYLAQAKTSGKTNNYWSDLPQENRFIAHWNSCIESVFEINAALLFIWQNNNSIMSQMWTNFLLLRACERARAR